tara:strand:- start:8981 stop:9178 length:198 start_codon:yes stop_codon:yes gene_type:complete
MNNSNENLNAKSKDKQTTDSRNENLESSEGTNEARAKESEEQSPILIDLDDPFIADIFFMTDTND